MRRASLLIGAILAISCSEIRTPTLEASADLTTLSAGQTTQVHVLRHFEGGSGQIAIHGLLNLGGTPGTAVSHGCVRLATDDLRWLVARVSGGVPVTITRSS